jgi:hypothetical protein
MSRVRVPALAALVLALVAPAFAQGTNGVLEGTVSDEQGLALPGAAVSAHHTETGFSRSTTSDAAGVYRIPGLPIGVYEVKTELAGFGGQTRRVAVNVGATSTVDFRMTVAVQAEELTVVAEAPLIDVRDSGVGEVVTAVQIENLPLNGRQFANLAALVPGVSLGFHTDPTKSTQFAPSASGGGGRNINYLIDGGDNNDDTVGGLVQNFPLDSIGEFKYETQRFKAEYGRANGGVLTVVTKSGTNELRGSAFEYFRDKSLNAKTETEKRANNGAGVEKGEYRKHQFGASLGGPITRDKTHFFLSFERLQQDTTQVVNTRGLFPDKDGVFDVPYRENMGVAKITHQLNADHYLSVRYGYNDNSQPYGAANRSTFDNWGDSQNKFHSANVNLNSVLGGGRLNEFVFQFSYFKNHIAPNSTLPSESFPNGVTTGQNGNTPQTTEQHKYQFRDDFTWNRGSHEFKVGVAFINEPVLDITFNSGNSPSFTHLTDDPSGPISAISQSGTIGEGSDTAVIPNKQYAAYVQDTWRVNDKLTLDLGVRYDLVTGFAFDESQSILFQELQAAGRAGLLAGVIGMENFGREKEEDKNNIAPRAGFTYDTRGDGRFVVRGGAGRYYDFAYTNANILFAVASAQVPHGTIYSHSNTAGIRNADGSLYRVGQPLPENQIRSLTRPSFNHAADPLIKQPYTDQANLGFSLALGKDYALEVDGVYAEGKELGVRPRLNVRINGGARRFNSILPTFGATNFAVDVSRGRSHYKGLNVAVKKRWDGRLHFLASYTLSKATGTSRRATDEFINDTLVNAFDPFGDIQEGPVDRDARHRFNLSAVWSPGWDFTVSPIFRYRTAVPYTVITGVDNNRDGVNFDLPAGAETVNQARAEEFSQLDLRLSKKIKLSSRVGLELIAEGFNILNDTNPSNFVGNMVSTSFGQPQNFAGDFQRGEQRMVQLGARFEF